MSDGIDKSLAFFSICIVIILATFTINANWQNNELCSLRGVIGSMDDKINLLDKKVYLLTYRLAPSPEPPIYGDSIPGNRINRNINITYPYNESIIGKNFYVEGIAELKQQDSIYIIAKIGDKYWILMDGVKDQLGNWKGAKNCTLPIADNENYENYELFAIITQEPYGIGSCSDVLPQCLAQSDVVYLKAITS